MLPFFQPQVTSLVVNEYLESVKKLVNVKPIMSFALPFLLMTSFEARSSFERSWVAPFPLVGSPELLSNVCATNSAHLWSSALVFSREAGFLHAPFPAFLTGEIISIPLVLASSLSNASPLRYLLRLVLPTRSWPINTILVRLSKVSPVSSALLYASSPIVPLAFM